MSARETIINRYEQGDKNMKIIGHLTRRWILTLCISFAFALPFTTAAEQNGGDSATTTNRCRIRMKNLRWDPVIAEREFDKGALKAAREGNPLKGVVIKDGFVQRVGKRPSADDAKHIAKNAYFLLQFVGPTRQEWKDKLERAGARFHDYIPDYTFIVKLDRNALAVAQADENVRWIGVYEQKYKHSSDAPAIALGNDNLGPAGAADDPDAILPGSPVGDNRFVVVLFKGESVADVAGLVRTEGGTVLATSDGPNKSTLEVKIDPSKLAVIGAISSVKWIEKYYDVKLYNNVVAGDAVCAVKTVWDTQGLHGEGQVVGIADTGLDQGSVLPANLNDDFEDGASASRVLAILDTAGDANVSDPVGHGTHVAGSILGNGRNSGSTPTANSFPATCYAGMAPKAKCVFQAAGNAGGGLIFPADLNTLFADAQGQGAQLHSDSWGTDTFGAYNIKSQDVDEYMWANKNFLILFAAGNAGKDTDANGRIDFGFEGTVQGQIGAPATAKNCLTVGASESLRPIGWGGSYSSTWGAGWSSSFPVSPIASDYVSQNLNGMCAFSSRGPCDDGRLKPDIVAPGSNIASVRVPGKAYAWGVLDSFYAWEGGTSMSTPLVAGMAAIVRQFFTEGRYPGITTPSATLIKAVLLNGAVNMAPGQYGTDEGKQEINNVRPNNVAGWGRANLSLSLFRSGNAGLRIFGTDLNPADAVATGNVREYQVNAKAGSPVTVHLAWTDSPGTPQAGGGLVNDLDLVVEDPSSVLHYPSNPRLGLPGELLAYDNGVYAGNNGGTAGHTRVVKFTPSTYPVTLKRVRFRLLTTTSTQFDIRVYDDNGAGGIPGTQLTPSSSTTLSTGNTWIWKWYDISPITITSGSVYVGIYWTQAPVYVQADTSSSGHSWWHNGTSWSLQTREYAVHAWFDDGTSGDSTTYDRVNNVEGVEIPNPSAGTYKIRVTGHAVNVGDVAFGNKQPFSVVVSGDLPDLTKQAVWGF